MAMQDVIAQIDAEISKLEQAKTLLTAGATVVPASAVKGKRGRPKGSVSAKTASAKRTVSPEGRKRMAEAQRKRWAAKKAGK